MDTMGYAVFTNVRPVPGARLQMGLDGFREGNTQSTTYRFLVFSQTGESETVESNDEITFYKYTLPGHQSRLFHRVMSAHNKDIAKEYKSMFGGKRTKKNRRVTNKRRGGKKPPQMGKRKSFRRRRGPQARIGTQGAMQPQPQARIGTQGAMQPQGRPYDADPMAPPRQGALTWGDAAKLAAANAAGAVVAVVGEEAFEDM